MLFISIYTRNVYVALGAFVYRVCCRSTGGNPHHGERAFWLLLLVQHVVPKFDNTLAYFS